MASIRVMTWNVCGDKQARADLAATVISTEKPDILLFQEARKTNPALSNLYTTISTSTDFAFLFCDEYLRAGISYGGKNYYPDTSGKCYYCFYRKAKLSAASAMQRVDYRKYLSPGGGDANANLLTTRAPAYVELTEASSGATVLLFTWHAPLAGAGGGVFNAQAHAFFNAIATQMVKGKVGIIAGDMNAKEKQIAKSYDDVFETSGFHLDHILTNANLKNGAYYDDVMSDVHYLYLADVEWT
jgi:endonuclease/exonuclease/phosphatase family metal-dependent hydrolase